MGELNIAEFNQNMYTRFDVNHFKDDRNTSFETKDIICIHFSKSRLKCRGVTKIQNHSF